MASGIVKVYALRVYKGKITINDVPEDLKDDVREYLYEEYGWVEEE